MSELTVSIALIEDEAAIRHFLRATLEDAGFAVHEADNARQGMVLVENRKPDLLILDLGLPDLDGVEVIRRVRQWSDVPILVLSARAREAQKVEALDAGAEDYLTKPFGVAECLARVRVLLRRRLRDSASAQQVFVFGDVRVDPVNRLVSKAGREIRLTPIEYRLLGAMIRDAGKVLTHRELLRAVWGPSFSESHQYLRVYMGHLRQKLEDNPAMPQHILTEPGVGYRLLTDAS